MSYERVAIERDQLDIQEDRSPFMDRNKRVALIITSSLLFLGGLIVFSISWDTIDPTEYGFNYNGITGRLDPVIWDSGRYCIGPGHYFVKYPRIQTTVEFSLSSRADSAPVVTRTNDGVAITLSFSFQYLFNRDTLPEVYSSFTTNYQQPMIRVARNSLLQVAGNFTSTEYWLNRKKITDSMTIVLRQNLLNSVLINVTMFQLLVVALPQKYEDSIVATQVQQQQVIQQQYQKQVSAITSQIQQLIAQANQNITVIQSQANATAIGIMNAAQIGAFNYTQHVQAAAYANLQTELKMNSTQLMRYMKIRGIRDKKHGSIIVGLNSQ